MKVLSLRQPWATLVATGAKRFETRGWRPAHRGLLALHASSCFPPRLRLACEREPIRSLLAEAGCDDWTDLPLGALVGAVELVDCVPVEDLTELTELDRVLGDFSAGRWAWDLRQPRRWETPIPWTGRLGLFEAAIEPAIEALIEPAAPAARLVQGE